MNLVEDFSRITAAAVLAMTGLFTGCASNGIPVERVITQSVNQGTLPARQAARDALAQPAKAGVNAVACAAKEAVNAATGAPPDPRCQTRTGIQPR